MAKILEGQCVTGLEAVWVFLHGFAFALMAVMVGTDYLSPYALTAVMAAGGTYLLVLSELTAHTTVQEWAPLVAAVAGVGLLSKGGARYGSGESFVHPSLTSGSGPVLILSVLAGYVLAAFHLHALKAPGVEEWIPLLLAAGGVGLLSHAGARYGSGEDFFPKQLTTGNGPRNFLTGLGVFVVVSFLGAVESHKGTWEQWVGLAAAVAGVGLLSAGGARYAAGGDFLPEALASGPVPAAVMATLGAFVYTAMMEEVGVNRNGDLSEWFPLAGAVAVVGLLAHGGARLGADESFLPDFMSKGFAPVAFTITLVLYSIMALHAVSEPRGGLTMGLNLAGFASVVGGLAFYNNNKKQALVEA